MRKTILYIAVLLLSLPVCAQQERHFTFHYRFTVRNIAPGQKLQVWFPQAQSDRFQDVKILSMKGDLPVKKTHEPRYGDAIHYAVAGKDGRSVCLVHLEYSCVRSISA